MMEFQRKWIKIVGNSSVRPFWKIYNILSCHRGVKIWESWVSAKVVEEDAVRGQGASEGQRGDAVCLRLCGRMLRERARALSGSRHLRPLAGGSAMPAAPYRLGAGRRRRDTGWRAGRRRQCARRPHECPTHAGGACRRAEPAPMAGRFPTPEAG